MARGNFDLEFDKEFVSDDEHEIREEDHGKLLQAVEMMDNQLRIKPPSRTEPSSNISEFDLAPVKGGGVRLRDLAHSLEIRGKTFDADVAAKIHKLTKKSATLQKPLEKNQQQKIKRVVAYNNLTNHVARWDAVVQTNRSARTITFPMEMEPVVVKNSSEVAAMWQSQSQTDFEAGLNALHGMSKIYQEDKKEEEKFRLTLAELRQKRQEMAKLRCQQSYEAAKARRQNKIKSKSFHRVLRREKMQKQLKEFEALQKTDPAAALKRLEELDRVRAEERMTLRHKNTGHWARSRLIRAKYDPQTRQELAEQLAVSRDLTKKLKADDSSEDEQNGDKKEPIRGIPGDEDNPWITVKSSSEIDDFVSGYRKYWDELNKQAEAGKENPNGKVSDKESKMKNRMDDAMDHSDKSERMNELSKKQTNESMDECENAVHHENVEAEMDCVISVNGGEHSTSAALSVSMCESDVQSKTKEETDRVTDIENENDECEDSDKISVSMDSGESMFTSTSKIRKASPAKMRTKLDKKSKCKKTPKSKVKSTSLSWVVTPISTPKEHVSSRKSPDIKMTETPPKLQTTDNRVETPPKPRTSDKRVEMFLASVLPDVLEIEEKKKKKRKSALDKMFDRAGNEISTKLEDRFKELKSHFDSEGPVHPRSYAGRREEVDNDLGASLAVRSMRDARPREDAELLEGSLGRAESGAALVELAKAAAAVNPDTTPAGTSSRGGTAASKPAAAGTSTKPAVKNINPEKFIAAKPKVLLTAVPELTTAGEEALDDEMAEDQQQIITEAFADDNVVDDFRKEKEADIKKSQPGEIDLSLPGWGDWGGTGIVPQKKKSRFIILPPPAPPRKDADKSNVVINEEKAEGIREHQVWELPAPFTSVKDFETSIRAPVGRTWVPETAHKKLIAPAVITKIGTVIKPMNEEVLVNEKTLLDFSQ